MTRAQDPTAADPVTAVGAADVTAAVAACTDVLRGGLPADWSRPAGTLTWDCRSTLLHVNSDLFAYAGQLAGRFTGGYITLDVHEDDGAGVDGLLQAVTATGGMLAAVVAATPAGVRAYHPYGASDPEGFAAMGIVEVLVHTHDIAAGLGLLPWEPPAGLCAKVLRRLFPEAPRDTAPWPTLLWATGRGELPGHPRRDQWRWHGAPLGDAPDAPGPSARAADDVRG
ncbi:maleylpyruvate isomerase N-terminal domain-containing protein [Streptomyces sp. NPDC059637]|uniref:maleylpyruvate isomerase N-terminal domain-containing protein n=1 Tax=Streptomyces sp. NPDC059637 TaxID=3347752 RepID=UPI0036AE35EB